MFFIGIMGIEQKQKHVSVLPAFSCKICSSSGEADLIKTYSSLHFFFIPVLKFNHEYYAICRNCRSIFKVSSDKGKAFEKGTPLTYWDYQIHKAASSQPVCKKCGRTLNDDYDYCPFCGHKRY